MLRTCWIETAHLDDVGPICKTRKLPPSRALFLAPCSVENAPPPAEAVPVWQICPFVSLAAKLPRLGTSGAGRFVSIQTYLSGWRDYRIYKRTYVHTYIRTYVHACMHAYMYMYIYICKCMCTCICICMCICMCIRVCIRVYVLVYVNVNVYVKIYRYKYMYMHMHM
jgi:hypothetical protein